MRIVYIDYHSCRCLLVVHISMRLLPKQPRRNLNTFSIQTTGPNTSSWYSRQCFGTFSTIVGPMKLRWKRLPVPQTIVAPAATASSNHDSIRAADSSRINHRSNVGVGIIRISNHQLSAFFNKSIFYRIINVFMDQNMLYANTALSRLKKCTRRDIIDQGASCSKVFHVVDDTKRGTATFQNDGLLTGIGLDLMKAHLRTTSKCH